jgi:hypothetical protein
VSRAVLVGMQVLWAALMVWSLRKYWRTPDDPREARIYRDGKFSCVFVTVGMAVVGPKVWAFPGVPYVGAWLFAERLLYFDWVDERALS